MQIMCQHVLLLSVSCFQLWDNELNVWKWCHYFYFCFHSHLYFTCYRLLFSLFLPHTCLSICMILLPINIKSLNFLDKIHNSIVKGKLWLKHENTTKNVNKSWGEQTQKRPRKWLKVKLNWKFTGICVN